MFQAKRLSTNQFAAIKVIKVEPSKYRFHVQSSEFNSQNDFGKYCKRLSKKEGFSTSHRVVVAIEQMLM
jgi:hypothetical protein